MEKSVDAFRTISEVAEDLELPQHVLRFWETRFPQIKPLKRAGGRRYYRPADVVLLKTIRQLLYEEGFTIKGVQKLFKEQGMRAVRDGNVPVPLDLAQIEAGARGFAVAEAAAAVAQPVVDDDRPDLPDSLVAALEAGVQGAIATQLSRRDLAVLREAIVTLDECERLLKAARRAAGRA